ncbi:MAG: hypothetical protein BroJett042_05090 [Bacteroidota bacterium]|nr:MAG: hypothetical protein BroJett042_05090 [Bacteroidota bacterium]
MYGASDININWPAGSCNLASGAGVPETEAKEQTYFGAKPGDKTADTRAGKTQ